MSIVRTLFFATRVAGQPAPFDTLHISALYPARLTGSERERQHGVVDAEPDGAPYPVVLFLNGVNCDPHRYQWLLLDLVRRGTVCVTVSWVAETLPGIVALTPGMDLRYATPDTYGSGPTASAVAPTLEALRQANAGDGPLGGMLDLGCVVLGGHSGGGAVALQSASPGYFAGLSGVFAYAAHTVPAAMLGFDAGKALPISDEVPVLLLGGGEDGVIVSASHRYDEAITPTTLLQRTFDQAIAGERGDRYLAMLRGANHFTVVHPSDPTAGRAFLDRTPTEDEDALRALTSRLVGHFIDGPVRGRSQDCEALHAALCDPLIEHSARK